MAYTGELAALGTTFCWAISVLTFESAGRRIGSMTVNFLRLVLAVGILAVMGLLSSRHLALPTDATCEQWQWLGLSGLAGFFVGDLCLFKSFIMIGPRLATLVFTLAPPLTALLGWLVLGEHLAWLSWVGMIGTISGVVWVVAEGKVHATVKHWRPSVWGVTLALLGALGQAAGNVLVKLAGTEYDPYAVSQIRAIAGVMGFAVLFLVLGWYPRVWRGLKDRPAMATLTLGTVAGPVVGVSLMVISLYHLHAGKAATIVAILPVVILPFTAILYRERITLRAVFGAFVAVGGVALLFTTPAVVHETMGYVTAWLFG